MPLCSLLPSGNAVALVTHVLIDTTHVRVTTVAFNDDAVADSHTHTALLHVRVVGDQDAIHVLIRVRHRSPIFPEGFPSVGVFHTITQYFSKPLSASCFDSLTSSSSRDFSASCTIRSTSILWMIVGSTQLSVVFDETWNSSMMFSSTLTVVQSSGPSDDSLVLRPPALSFAAWPCARCTLKHPFSDSFTSSCP